MNRTRLLIAAMFVSIIAVGCSRQFWREQADKDSYNAIAERMDDPRWVLPRVTVEPDPRSRHAWPFNADHSPLPPDDAAASKYMQVAYGIRGYKGWHKMGRAFSIENPQWKTHLGLPAEFCECPTNEQKVRIEKLTLPQAIELSYIHSRDYQTQIETLYLSSLALSFDRFQFDVRYLGGGREPSADLDYTNGPFGASVLGLNSRGGVSQLLPSGGQWAVELANNTLWLFAGPNQTTTASTLGFSLTQPLLFAAGRKVVMENLTQSERNVLYAVRDLARFRKLFFARVVSGGQSVGYLGLLQQVQLIRNQRGNVARLAEQVSRQRALTAQRKRIRIGILGLPADVEAKGIPKELTGEITETEGALFYDAGNLELGGQRSASLQWLGPMSEAQEKLLRATAGEPAPPTVQERMVRQWELTGVLPGLGAIGQRIELAEDHLKDARRAVFRKAITELILQVRTVTETLTVTQLLSQLNGLRQGLRSAEQNFQDALDRFKIELGLPPDVELTIDDALLKPFELIDPGLAELEGEFEQVISLFPGPADENPDLEQLRRATAAMVKLNKALEKNGMDSVRQDFERVKEMMSGKAETESALPPREIKDPIEKTRVQNDVENDRRLFGSVLTDFERRFAIDFNSVESRLDKIQQQLSERTVAQANRRAIRNQLADLREDMLKISQNLQVIQIDLRTELVSINRVEIDLERAVCLALDNRLDLKNSRGAVMDARRRVEVAANALKAGVNLRAEGNLRTPVAGNKPFDFRSENADIRFGIGITTPLDRMSQRNNYRSALITFRQTRRTYMALEDNIKFQVRNAWRRLQVLEQNFNTARQAVRLAAKQLDNAIEEANAPQQGGAGSRDRDGLNLINALNSVLRAQNDLISIWVQYESARLALYRDMGVMQVDPQGVWGDGFYQKLAARSAPVTGVPGASGIEVLPPNGMPPEPAIPEAPPRPIIPDNGAGLIAPPAANPGISSRLPGIGVERHLPIEGRPIVPATSRRRIVPMQQPVEKAEIPRPPLPYPTEGSRIKRNPPGSPAPLPVRIPREPTAPTDPPPESPGPNDVRFRLPSKLVRPPLESNADRGRDRSGVRPAAYNQLPLGKSGWRKR